MEAARSNNVPGILADCGGACACATCHVMIAAEWQTKLPEIQAEENMMLDLGLEERTEDSRLSWPDRFARAPRRDCCTYA